MRAPAVAVALSWALLAAWLVSPYARFLDHATAASDVPSALGVGALFAAGWALMTLAMMLPSASALLRLFERVVAPRADASRLLVLLVLGFLGVWTSIGLAFRAFDTQVHSVVDASAWLSAHTPVVGAAALITAGAFQFSSLKRRCLTACRKPRSFIVTQWQGQTPQRDAVRIGVNYGWSCVGCCWTLMLLLFGLGMSNLLWMFAMGAYVAVERNTAVGPRLVRPVGVALIAGGVAMAALGVG